MYSIKNILFKAAVFFVLFFSNINVSIAEISCDQIRAMSIGDIKKNLIKSSIINYTNLIGSCPCPYSVDGGKRCDDNSAWSQHDGEQIYCYESDINISEISQIINHSCNSPRN